MIGFKVSKSFLNGFGEYFAHTLVYVGKENLFIKGKMKPLVWQKIDRKLFPSNVKTPKDSVQHLKYSPGTCYKYSTQQRDYFVQDMIVNTELYGRRLLVVDSNSQELIFSQVYYDSDGVSLTPLNFVNNHENKELLQWTGILFKNKPPVILGFEYISFGCEDITFLNRSEPAIYLRCDNRH